MKTKYHHNKQNQTLFNQQPTKTQQSNNKISKHTIHQNKQIKTTSHKQQANKIKVNKQYNKQQSIKHKQTTITYNN